MACPPPGSHQGGNGAARPAAAREPLESESREPRQPERKSREPLQPERESREPLQPERESREPLQPERESREPRCAMCGGPWRDLGHCKGVCLRCGFMQSCVDTI